MAIKIEVTPGLAALNATGSGGQGNHDATGGPGRAPGSPNSAMRIRIHKVARMRVNGVRDTVIQHLLGIQPPAFRYLTELPEYKDVEEQILLGHLTELDEATAGQVSVLRQQAREAVPSALRCLVEAVNQRRDLRTALAAAGEILDRDPDKTFVKSKGNEPIDISGHRLPDTLMEVTSKDADSVIEDLKITKEKVM
jgi:hypothetical protein